MITNDNITTIDRKPSLKKPNGVFRGKKIFVISGDERIVETVRQCVASRGAIFFSATTPKDAIGNVLAKNPDLVVYDDLMPEFNGATVFSAIKRARPKGRILFLSRTSVVLRSIDVSARGVSFSIARDSSPEQMYNAIKHCLGITSVPRVENLSLANN